MMFVVVAAVAILLTWSLHQTSDWRSIGPVRRDVAPADRLELVELAVSAPVRVITLAILRISIIPNSSNAW